MLGRAVQEVPCHVRQHDAGLRVVGVELGGASLHRPAGRPVDVVGVHAHRRDAARDVRRRQPLRGEGQVGPRAEAAERLAEHRPRRIAQQVPAQHLGVGHDGVRPEEREPVRLRLGGRPARVCRSCGVDRPVPRWSSSSTRYRRNAQSSQPGASPPGRGERPPGTALQEQQVRLVGAGEVGGADLAGVHLDALAGRVLRIERHLHDVVARHAPGCPAPPRRTSAPLAAPPPSATSPPLHPSGHGERRHQRGEQQHREQLERHAASRRRRPARAAGPGPGSDRASRRRRRRRG